jgi:lipopolysaccharide transport system permease protein
MLPPERIFDASFGGRFIDWEELWRYRDMFYFLIWKDIKTRYAQSVLGLGWAVLPPIFRVVVFTIVFGNLAQISSDGAPYALFSFTALVAWGYFSNALSGASGSLLTGVNLINKVYFPRMILPLVGVFSKVIDFLITLALLFILIAWFRVVPTIWTLFLPVLILMMTLNAAGLGMILTALAVQYRDVKFGQSFIGGLLMYASPVIYPTSLIPEQYRLLYALNPMVGIIEGFRAALLNTNPMPWDMLGMGSITTLVIFVSGTFYFRHRERVFADVV